jgi:hypothetical protein
MVPVDTLTITYGRTYDVWPLSNSYKNWITQFQDMYDHCNSQTTWSDHNIFDLTSSHFDSCCFWYLIIMIGHSQCSHYDTALMLPHVIKFLWSHQSVQMMGRSLELSPVPNPPFSGTTLHSWGDVWRVCRFWPDTHPWCVHHYGHRRTSWRGHWDSW